MEGSSFVALGSKAGRSVESECLGSGKAIAVAEMGETVSTSDLRTVGFHHRSSLFMSNSDDHDKVSNTKNRNRALGSGKESRVLWS